MTSGYGAASRHTFEAVAGNIARVMKGHPAAIRTLLSAFARGGHVLLENSWLAGHESAAGVSS